MARDITPDLDRAVSCFVRVEVDSGEELSFVRVVIAATLVFFILILN